MAISKEEHNDGRDFGHDPLLVGIDIGSTTVKLVAVDPKTDEVIWRSYQRHRAEQLSGVMRLMREFSQVAQDKPLRIAVTGSGGSNVADRLGLPFVQEVIANAIVLRRLHPFTRTAIEIGGQDAKVVFFSNDGDGALEVDDMRMNGTCAGGTGAFIDEIASLLNVATEDFNDLAVRGKNVYPISGRCGVFAKTDLQPLINQGIAKEDLALSAFHAIAKQTIGGLAQGRTIEPPVVFEGGPLLYNPMLVSVFVERLGISENDAIVPEDSDTIVAHGAALYLESLKDQTRVTASQILRAMEGIASDAKDEDSTAPLFLNMEDRHRFLSRHQRSKKETGPVESVQKAYLGIDSGSTTTKMALVDTDGRLLDAAYASNNGEPLDVAKNMLIAMRERWKQAGIEIPLAGVGATGYGERLFAEAYKTDCHVVETVAHARAAVSNDPEATFVLDIGGQDMKAIWLDHGIITDIVVNEACSSGCGSFLEGFASSLGIRMEDMAELAFSSESPADLGSRCTVFMESSVISAQRNGKKASDIIAGLSRSIVENVFTKVIRSSKLDTLGSHIVVQGGTFANDAVLRAFEEYLGQEVTRADHPELAGAIGAALVTADQMSKNDAGCEKASSFIGIDAVEALQFARSQNAICPFCGNHCSRTIIRFSTGASYVTGNRCPRGERLPGNDDGGRTLDAINAPNLFLTRERLLFKEYLDAPLLPKNDTTIGLPRVLSMWDDAPFWQTFFQSLGFAVKFSRPSSRKRYEESLSYVASDTACFPAKLVHSHIRDLVDQDVDRIFMPIVTAMKPEGASPHSESMCALVKGYPMVIRSSDDPEKLWGKPFDTPLFHWHSDEDRQRQLAHFMDTTFGIDETLTKMAIEKGDAAKAQFRKELVSQGSSLINEVRSADGFAIVLASRPYHNDDIVNHGLPELIAAQGVPVLPVDALPELDKICLNSSRLDIVNNYHARMLRGALYAASSDCLEYAQIVSFGCGHDAYLSDEIVRLMAGVSNKAPLVLKVDEGDARGPLEIRVRSFLETVSARRGSSGTARKSSTLGDPYPVKFREEDKSRKTILVPNTSHAFARLMAAVFSRQGVRAVPLPLGGEKASALGKKYVHNDICYPAQMVIGEALEALESGKYDPNSTAVGMAKYLGDCRLTHYSALLRKALDDAGYPQVPIITNDAEDEKGMHPGFRMSAPSALLVAYTLPMIDALEELLRKIRPYELEKGAADTAFEQALDLVVEGLQNNGMRGARKGFKDAIRIMGKITYDRTTLRPKVLIVGEYLLNFHSGANRDIERYLEEQGMEVVEARMTDVIRKTYFYQLAQVNEFKVSKPFGERAFLEVADHVFEMAHNVTDRIAGSHPLYEPPTRMHQLVKASDSIVHHTFDAGEGVLIPAEVLHHYERGVRSFIILQPFGCLPNHIVGRGILKRLTEECPDARILSLDFDPDVSIANIENRLQMLIMRSKEVL